MERLLNSLRNDTSPGSDNIDGRLLKIAVKYVSLPICDIFNICFTCFLWFLYGFISITVDNIICHNMTDNWYKDLVDRKLVGVVFLDFVAALMMIYTISYSSSYK